MEFERILVPVDGTETDEEAISLACTISKVSGKTRVFAVHIIPVERALPLDAELSSAINKSEGILAKAEEIAEKQGVKLETDLLQAREVANAIIDEAVEKGFSKPHVAGALKNGNKYKGHLWERM